MNTSNAISSPLLPTLEGIRSVYFVGIGGIGMSALARYFRSLGARVEGYDRTATPLTRQLEAEGIPVTYEDSPVDGDFGLVVYTPAIPATHRGLAHFRERGLKVVKRSDVLQAVSADTFNICVAGTHGKTTISTMVAHLLRHTGYGCNAFLGGISANYNTNFWSSERPVAVIEADEYDRSFLKLSPDVALVSAMDADHLDIYGTEAALREAFLQFAGKVRSGGTLLMKFGLPARSVQGEEGVQVLTYSLQNEAADVYGSTIVIEEGGYRFDAVVKGAVLSGFELRMGGMHNVENAVAAIAVAHLLDIDTASIRAAVAAFKGVRRRFEYLLPPEKTGAGGYINPVLIDDYAHHPEELRALLSSVKSLFPERKMTVVFQPHLFTRTRDFAEGFADALSIAHRVVLMPIYPARELPIEGVTSSMILDRVDRDDKQLLDRGEVLSWLEGYVPDTEFGEVFVLAGAGDIDTLAGPAKNILEKK